MKIQRRLPGNLAGLTVLAITVSTAALLLVIIGHWLGLPWLQWPR